MVLLRRRKNRADAPVSAASATSAVRAAAAPRPLDVRSRLLQAADEILGAEGIQALTQTRVAEAAGVRQSHLTYYFATRSDLVRALVEATAAAVTSDFAGTADGSVTLQELRRRLVDRVSDPRMARRIMGILLSNDEDPSLLPVLDALEAHVCLSLASTLRQQGLAVSDLDAMLLHSTLMGIALRSYNRCTQEDLRKARTLIGEAFDRLVELTGPAAARSRRIPALSGVES